MSAHEKLTGAMDRATSPEVTLEAWRSAFADESGASFQPSSRSTASVLRPGARARPFGLEVGGLTALSLSDAGLVSKVALHHRLFGVVTRFAEALGDPA
jgi:hypothetical protein